MRDYRNFIREHPKGSNDDFEKWRGRV
jgi:hypothetical protein